MPIDFLRAITMNPKNNFKALIALVLMTSVLCLFPARTRACGPFFTDAIFVFTKHPDFPLEQFAGALTGVYPEGYLDDLRREWT